MTFYFEDCKSISISEGIKGVRILIVNKKGKEIEYITNGNKADLVK